MHLLTLPANEFVIGTAGDPVNTVALKWNDSTGVMQMTTATAPTSVPSTGAYLYAPTGALETYSQAGLLRGLGRRSRGQWTWASLKCWCTDWLIPLSQYQTRLRI